MPYEMVMENGQHCLRNKTTGKMVAGSCHADKQKTMAMMRALYANIPEASASKAVWSTAYINDLPDSAFLYIEPGGSKDGEGKTTPRSLRHFPYKDSSGNVDLAHLRNALARIPQSSLSADVKARVAAKAQAIAKAHGIGSEKSNYSEGDMDTIENESLTYYGGAVKALGGGRVGGYLVIFTGPESPDLQGEYFTKSTDFFIEDGEQRPILYRHGAHPVIKSRKLGRAKLTIDDAGVFLEGELNLRDNYEKAIYTLAEQGKLGWSSGSMGHLVTKKPNGKSLEILTWPIGEASLTPNPVEGRTVAIPVKSLMEEEILDDYVKEFEEEQFEFCIDGTPSIKSFCESVAPMSLRNGMHRSQSAADAAKEFITITRILGEAYDSYTSRLVKRSEHRFLKEGREIDSSTVAQVEQAIADIESIESAIQAIKESLLGIRKLSEMTKAEAKAMEEQARFALWNYYRISGYKPEELEDNA